MRKLTKVLIGGAALTISVSTYADWPSSVSFSNGTTETFYPGIGGHEIPGSMTSIPPGSKSLPTWPLKTACSLFTDCEIDFYDSKGNKQGSAIIQTSTGNLEKPPIVNPPYQISVSPGPGAPVQAVTINK